MNWLENTNTMSVEITTYCNSHCGACQRHVSPNDDTLHPGLVLQHMDVDLWKKIIIGNEKFGIRHMHLNGNWGDALMHPDFFHMIEFFVNNSSITMSVSTNGSLRTEKFWRELGKITKNRVELIFCLDGLEDTHSIYRKKTNFKKIIQNIKAFHSTGGQFNIMTTLFDHNLHQIDELEKLSKDLGSMRFRTRRNHSGVIWESDGVTVGSTNVKQHHLRETVWEFWPANNVHVHNDTICPWYNDRDVQVDPWGHIWTCCFASETRFSVDRYSKKHYDDDLYSEDLNLQNYSLEEIFQSDFWKSAEKNITSGNWFVCFDNCGIKSKKWEEHISNWEKVYNG